MQHFADDGMLFIYLLLYLLPGHHNSEVDEGTTCWCSSGVGGSLCNEER